MDGQVLKVARISSCGQGAHCTVHSVNYCPKMVTGLSSLDVSILQASRTTGISAASGMDLCGIACMHCAF